MEQTQDPGAASRSEGFRAQVRGWLTSTGAPPAWGLVGYMVCGLVAGAAAALALVATYLLWPRDREIEAAPVPAATT